MKTSLSDVVDQEASHVSGNGKSPSSDLAARFHGTTEASPKAAVCNRESRCVMGRQRLPEEGIFIVQKEEAWSEDMAHEVSMKSSSDVEEEEEEDGNGDRRQASGFATNHGDHSIQSACDALVAVTMELVDSLQDATFMPPVSCVYNPLVYAQIPHEQYIRKHGGRKIEVLLVGMNPGPYGMAQTGVPFGDSKIVQAFHGIRGNVKTPLRLHPKRPITGFDCRRSEISGQRLWGWARDRFGSAALFFKQFWVYNYCPLVFMQASGKNHTPDKLHIDEHRNLEKICNTALIKTIKILQPVFVVGIGKYAARKIRECNISGVRVGEIVHPSPANPLANKEWSKKIELQLEQLGVVFPKD